jgi:hypothetical protein
MKHVIEYSYTFMKDGKIDVTEDNWPIITVNSLSEVPSIGDIIHFRNSEDGPRGVYKVIERAMDVGQVVDEYHIELSVIVESTM